MRCFQKKCSEQISFTHEKICFRNLCCRYLTNRGIPTFYEDRIVETNTKNLSYDLSDRHQLWAQSSFEKHYVVLRLLEMDYDVFLSDIDIVIHRNPWPHFKRDADFEYQGEKLIFEEELNEDVIINTGFFLVKPTPKVKAMFNESLYYSHTKLQTAQTVMNKIYQKYKKMNKTMFLNYTDVYGDDIPTSDKMIFRVLPILEFASGGAFLNHAVFREVFHVRRVGQFSFVIQRASFWRGITLLAVVRSSNSGMTDALFFFEFVYLLYFIVSGVFAIKQ